MESGPAQIAPRFLPALFEVGAAAGLSDHELLGRFAARRGARDEVAEPAFAALVSRHGLMVLRACRAVLGDRHEAEHILVPELLEKAITTLLKERGDEKGRPRDQD